MFCGTPRYSTMALCLLIIALNLQENVWCFQSGSSSSTLQRRSASRWSFSPVAKKASREDVSGLFPGKGPYVPSGLSEDEYLQIKKQEADELKSKNFGAWGPRFRQDESPEVNWLFMPALWTNGAAYRPESQMVGAEATQPTNLSRVYQRMQQAAPGFILACILLDFFATTAILLRSTEWTIRKSVLTILKLTFLTKKPFAVMSVVRNMAIGIVASSALSPLMNHFLERMNRMKLWSAGRTIRIAAGGVYGSLLVLAGVLHIYTAWL